MPFDPESFDAQLFGGGRTLSLEDLAERSGLSVDFVGRYWRTMGLPQPGVTDVVYTEQDAAALCRVAELMTVHGLDERTVITLTRAVGHTADRLALWQVEAIVESLGSRYDLDDTTARLTSLDRLPDLVPILELQAVHAWRRQMGAVAARVLAEFGGERRPEAIGDGLPLARAVGFADMVSFTRRTAGLGSTDLSEFVQRFETAARDVVTTAGGRVVKTIGDAVLFVADDVATGAEVALGLARTLGDESAVEDDGPARAGSARGVTPVRVGMVWGRVLSRFGDVFGPSVNVAARLTDAAEPSSVLVDEPTAALLAGLGRYTLEPQPPRDLAGLGPTVGVRLTAREREDAPADGDDARA